MCYSQVDDAVIITAGRGVQTMHIRLTETARKYGKVQCTILGCRLVSILHLEWHRHGSISTAVIYQHNVLLTCICLTEIMKIRKKNAKVRAKQTSAHKNCFAQVVVFPRFSPPRGKIFSLCYPK